MHYTHAYMHSWRIWKSSVQYNNRIQILRTCINWCDVVEDFWNGWRNCTILSLLFRWRAPTFSASNRSQTSFCISPPPRNPPFRFRWSHEQASPRSDVAASTAPPVGTTSGDTEVGPTASVSRWALCSSWGRKMHSLTFVSFPSLTNRSHRSSTLHF